MRVTGDASVSSVRLFDFTSISLRVVIVCGVNDLLARLVSVFHFPFCVFFRHG